MKSLTLIAVVSFALFLTCSSAPVENQQLPVELQARIDFYQDFLSGLFSNLVTTTFGSVSNFLNQLITENPLGIGKRDLEDARAGGLTFFYENVLQDLFSGLVTNTFSTISNTLNDLINKNPLGIGKRDLEDARAGGLTFFYENVLQDLFSGLVTNTFSTISNTLNDLINKNPLGIGKRNVDEQQIQNILQPVLSSLLQQFQSFIPKIIAAAKNPIAVKQVVDIMKNQIQTSTQSLIQQLSQVLPSNLIKEATQIVNNLQGALTIWSSGLAGSLGPVIGPFSG